MKLVEHTDPILRTPLQEFDFNDPPVDPLQFSKDIIQVMYDNNGMGLAANQVGMPYRMFAMAGGESGDFACFNPRIVNYSRESQYMEEGCLSYPGLFVSIKRPKSIRVRFQAPNGVTVTETFAGMTARVFQHELDHLDGIVHLGRATLYHKEQAMKKWKRNRRAA